MKKTSKTALTAAILTAAMSLSSCHVDQRDSEIESVYGPPPDYSSQEETTAPATTEYDPAEDEIQDVYGPPPGEY